MVPSGWKIEEQLVKKLNIKLPYNSASPLPDLYLKEAKAGIRTGMCILCSWRHYSL